MKGIFKHAEESILSVEEVFQVYYDYGICNEFGNETEEAREARKRLERVHKTLFLINHLIKFCQLIRKKIHKKW